MHKKYIGHDISYEAKKSNLKKKKIQKWKII